MRVVFLTHNFPRFPGDISGNFLVALAHGLLDRGVALRVIAPADRGDTGAAELLGIPVRRVRYAAAAAETLAYSGTMLASLRRPGGLLALAGMFRALRRAVVEERAAGADVVHAHWCFPAGLAAPEGVPLVVTAHGTDAVLLARSQLARLVTRPRLARARVVSAVSSYHAKLLAGAFGVMPRVQPMPSVVRPTGWSEGGGGLLVLGRLSEQKRVDLALRAASLMAGKGRPLTLTVAGDGPAREGLERLAQGLDARLTVRFLGHQQPEQVRTLLGHADLVLFPARDEGYGLAAAEALMAGVPVVACADGGGVLDIVPGGGAGRHATPDPAALAQAAAALLEDPTRLDAARQAGTALRARLSPAHVAEVFDAWYREARDAH